MKEIMLTDEQYKYVEQFTKCVWASVKGRKEFEKNIDYMKIRDGKGNIIVNKVVNYPSSKHLELKDIDNMSLFFYNRLVKPEGPDGPTNLYMKTALEETAIYVRSKVDE